MQLTLGADPEFFLLKNGQPVSAHDLLPGTKEEPFPVPRGAIQVDGTAVEFNVWPADNAREFANNIAQVLGALRDMIPLDYEFYFRPTVKYDPAYFKTLPIYVKQLGCDPDFNATLKGVMNPSPKRAGTLRTGAGHLHVGWGQGFDVTDNTHIDDCCAAVNFLDGTLGLMEKTWCNDDQRRKLYGKPGAFRPKPYGVEYRVLSNSWLNYPKIWPWLFDTIEQSLIDLADGDEPMIFGSPKFENFNFSRACLAPRYPMMPINTSAEAAPWEYSF